MKHDVIEIAKGFGDNQSFISKDNPKVTGCSISQGCLPMILNDISFNEDSFHRISCRAFESVQMLMNALLIELASISIYEHMVKPFEIY